MAFPAEEPLDIRDLAREVMNGLHWQRGDTTIAAAAGAFWRRVPRGQVPAVCDQLAAMLIRDIIRDHDAQSLRERAAAAWDSTPHKDTPPRPPAGRETGGPVLVARSESPGFSAPNPVPVSAAAAVPPFLPRAQWVRDTQMGIGAGELTPPVANAQVSPTMPPPLAETAPAAEDAPVAKFASAKIAALHDLWPELGTTVTLAGGQRKLVAKCGITDVNYQLGVHSDRKNRATRALAEAGSAVKHWQGIRDELARLGDGAVVEDLPEQVKDRLFQRRAA